MKTRLTDGHFSESMIKAVLLASAFACVGAICLIAAFIAGESLPALSRIGLARFLGGLEWRPERGHFGIFPMIAGTAAVTAGALLVGLPLGLAGAIFLAEIAPVRMRRIVRPAVELLAGIPSVVYGFYGISTIVPFLRARFGGPGFSVLAGSLVLSIMILPTVVTIAEDSIRSVPREYKEGSLALGATHWHTIRHVVLPASRTGIIAAAVLGMGRAVGETMAVIMVTGNSPIVPGSLLDPVRTLTGNIAMEMGYASGVHQEALFATGLVLFAFVLAATAALNLVTRRGDARR